MVSPGMDVPEDGRKARLPHRKRVQWDDSVRGGPEAPVHTRFPCPARVAGPAEPHGVFHCDTGRNAAAVSEHGIHITKLSERWGILIALDTRAIDLSAGV